MTVHTRFAPSPTGLLHIGGVRTALYAWAFARRHGGVFSLRIEDTDGARSTPEALAAITEGLGWLGLLPAAAPVVQSTRLARYRAAGEALVASGHAFWCWDASPRPSHDSGAAPFRSPWRALPPPPAGVGAPVLRFRAPEGDGSTAFDDAVKGRVETPHNQLEDWVLLRSDGWPTYNLAAVVDDADAGMTHIIRGDDHVANTAKQILTYRALGRPVPTFAHLPLILDEDGKKLSKRRSPEAQQRFPTDVAAMRKLGILPSALLNYLARLGWSKASEEVFEPEAFAGWFDLADVQRGPAQVEPAKLHWLNAQHLRRLPPDALWAWANEQVEGGLSQSLRPTWPAIASALQARSASTSAMQADVRRLAQWRASALPLPVAAPADLGPAWAALGEAATAEGWTAHADEHLRAAASLAGVKFGTFAAAVRTSLTQQNPSLPLSLMLVALGDEGARSWLGAVLVASSRPALRR